MSTFFGTYGDDAEYDAYIEKRIDPEWTGRETDPLGWRADRAQARWERDRGAADIHLFVGALLIAFGFLTLLRPDLALWLVAFCLVYMAIAVPFAVFAGRSMKGGTR